MASALPIFKKDHLNRFLQQNFKQDESTVPKLANLAFAALRKLNLAFPSFGSVGCALSFSEVDLSPLSKDTYDSFFDTTMVESCGMELKGSRYIKITHYNDLSPKVLHIEQGSRSFTQFHHKYDERFFLRKIQDKASAVNINKILDRQFFLKVFSELPIPIPDKKTLVFVHVLPDGIGDFYNAILLFNNLKALGLTNISLIALLPYDRETNLNTFETLKKYGFDDSNPNIYLHPYEVDLDCDNELFGNGKEPIKIINPAILTKLNETEVLVQSSHNSCLLPAFLRDHFEKNPTVLTVGELSVFHKPIFSSTETPNMGFDSFNEMGLTFNPELEKLDNSLDPNPVARIKTLSTSLLKHPIHNMLFQKDTPLTEEEANNFYKKNKIILSLFNRHISPLYHLGIIKTLMHFFNHEKFNEVENIYIIIPSSINSLLLKKLSETKYLIGVSKIIIQDSSSKGTLEIRETGKNIILLHSPPLLKQAHVYPLLACTENISGVSGDTSLLDLFSTQTLLKIPFFQIYSFKKPLLTDLIALCEFHNLKKLHKYMFLMHLFNEFTKKKFSDFFIIDHTTDVQTEQLTKEMGELLQDEDVFEEWKTLHKIIRADFDAKDRIKAMLLKSHFEEKFPMLAELQQILTDQYIKKEINGISMMRIYREKLDELLTSEAS